MDPPPATPVEKDNSLMIAIVGGLTSVAASLVSVLAAPKAPDPLLQLLMAKLLDDGGKKGDPMPAMPPMPPPVDPTEQLKNLAAVVQSLRGPEVAKTDDRLMDYLMKERMSPAEVLALVNQVKGERGTDDFKKSMENIGIMLNAVTQLRSHTEPGAGAGFWDAIGALVQNKELAGTVVEAVRGRVAQRQPEQQLPPQQQRPMLPANDPVVAKARELAARRLVLEEQDINRREQAAGITTSAPVPVPTPVATARVVQPAAPAAPAEVSVPPPPGLQKIPQLPGNIADFVNSYVEAKDDDAALVETTIEMLFSLGENEQWKPYAEVIFSLIANSDRGRFLNYMASFFINIKAIGLIEEALAERVMQALANNFQAIVEGVKEHLENSDGGDGDGEEGEEGEEEEEDILKLGEEQPLPE
jgi:hypothetical protein